MGELRPMACEGKWGTALLTGTREAPHIFLVPFPLYQLNETNEGDLKIHILKIARKKVGGAQILETLFE